MHHGGEGHQGPPHGKDALTSETRDGAGARGATGRRLAGVRVAVTRPVRRAQSRRALFHGEGARVFVCPTIRLAPPEDIRPLLEAADEVPGQDWVVVTSPGGVGALAAASAAHPARGRRLGEDTRFCAVGTTTAAALEAHGIRADLVPERFVAEGLVEALEAQGEVAGRSFLLVRAERARDLLPRALRQRRGRVRDVAAYRTLPDEKGARRLAGLVAEGQVDVLTFTSGSTVESFHAAWIDRGVAHDLPPGVLVAAIGPVTADAARRLGLPVHLVPERHTTADLARAVASRFGVLGKG